MLSQRLVQDMTAHGDLYIIITDIFRSSMHCTTSEFGSIMIFVESHFSLAAISVQHGVVDALNKSMFLQLRICASLRCTRKQRPVINASLKMIRKAVIARTREATRTQDDPCVKGQTRSRKQLHPNTQAHHTKCWTLRNLRRSRGASTRPAERHIGRLFKISCRLKGPLGGDELN